jgi:hypothetical protein
MADERALAQEYIKKLDRKVADIDISLEAMYKTYLELEEEHVKVRRHYRKELRAVKELQREAATQQTYQDQQLSSRKGTPQDTETRANGGSGSGSVPQNGVYGGHAQSTGGKRAARLANEPGGRRIGVLDGKQRSNNEDAGKTQKSKEMVTPRTEPTGIRGRAGNTSVNADTATITSRATSQPASEHRPRNVVDDTQKHNSGPYKHAANQSPAQMRDDLVRRPRTAEPVISARSKANHASGVVMANPQRQNQWQVELATVVRPTLKRVETAPADGNIEGAAGRQRQNEPRTGLADKSRNKNGTISIRAKEVKSGPTPYTAELEAIKAAERRERRNKLKAALFG